ncbi:MAG: hypothetical protein HeimC3_30350 [Candidatus Heimdallarchaeota archaeon LC_3]|nr:MAG: hypothetical protein HeimC3_30350 [Candidatus Heimdallarchaeota archaeon LC_3]
MNLISFPTLDSPDDLSYTEGSIGHNITWTAYDNNPVNYTLLRNSIEIENNSWISGDPLKFNVDGLVEGTYNFTLMVYDKDGLYAVDTVILMVVRLLITPRTNSPDDVTFLEGIQGINLTWIGIDDNPSTYIIYLNGTLFLQGSWENNSKISFSLENLQTGEYNFTIVLFDLDDLTITDTVFVIVKTPETTITISTITETTSKSDTTASTGAETTITAIKTSESFGMMQIFLIFPLIGIKRRKKSK